MLSKEIPKPAFFILDLYDAFLLALQGHKIPPGHFLLFSSSVITKFLPIIKTCNRRFHMLAQFYTSSGYLAL